MAEEKPKRTRKAKGPTPKEHLASLAAEKKAKPKPKAKNKFGGKQDPANCKAPPWCPRKYTDAECERLAKALVEWAHTDEAIVIETWLSMNGLYYDACMKLCSYSKSFKEALKMAKGLIGSRREALALYGKIDAGIVKKTAPLYSKPHADWELKLRGQDNHAVNRALNIFCRGKEAEAAEAEADE